VFNPFKLYSSLKEKYREDYYSHCRTDLLPFINGNPEYILDIGCSKGLTGKLFKEHFEAKYVAGVEVNPDAASIAEEHLDDVYVLDLNKEPLPGEDDFFDLMILGDILEHLVEPYSLLKAVHKKLKNGGQAIISVPNIRNWRILFELIFKGDWRYVDAGVLDKTHLRFFARKSMKRMIFETGFEIKKYGCRLRFLEKILNILSLSIFKGFLTSQNYFSIIKIK